MVKVAYGPLEINFRAKMSDEEFLQFCQDNRDLRIERDKNGNVIIITPVSFNSGWQETEIISELREWNKKRKLGKVFSSSTGVTLPNTAIRSADAAWLSKKMAATLNQQQQNTFAPVCPEFVAELRSKTDNLKTLKAKMEEWIENGAQLGWLLDPAKEKAWIYRADGSATEVVGFDNQLSGENILPEFTFDLSLLRI